MKLKFTLIGLLCVMQPGLVRSGWFENETQPSAARNISAIAGVAGLYIFGIRQAFKNKCEKMLEEYKTHLHQYHSSEFDANNGDYGIAAPITCALVGGFRCGLIGSACKNSICYNIDVKISAYRVLANPSRISYSFAPINPQLCYRNITMFEGTCNL